MCPSPDSSEEINLFPEFPEGMAYDVIAELTDPLYLNGQHYSRNRYNEGCRGPLCKKRNNDYGRESNERKAIDAGRAYSPMHRLRNTSREAELNLAIAWHYKQLAEQLAVKQAIPIRNAG